MGSVPAENDLGLLCGVSGFDARKMGMEIGDEGLGRRGNGNGNGQTRGDKGNNDCDY